MTFKESMVKAMTDRGMFPDQAETVIMEYIANDVNPMMDRWNENVEGYPEVMQNVLWMGVMSYAYEWIKENKPMAWFRPMFNSDEMKEIMPK
jgi:hypothetical protein